MDNFVRKWRNVYFSTVTYRKVLKLNDITSWTTLQDQVILKKLVQLYLGISLVERWLIFNQWRDWSIWKTTNKEEVVIYDPPIKSKHFSNIKQAKKIRNFDIDNTSKIKNTESCVSSKCIIQKFLFDSVISIYWAESFLIKCRIFWEIKHT